MRFCFATKDFIEPELYADKLAVVGEDYELIWKDFQKSVDQLCEEFRNKGLDQLAYPVMVYGHKSAQMIVVMYAMMKLEIPYIPVDIIYPFERIKKIQNTSNTQVVINTTSDSLNLPDSLELMISKNGSSVKGDLSPKMSTEKNVDPLIYTIFTSGSTGEPKGVMISTEAVQSFTRWMTGDDFGFSEKDTFINTAILSFDLSVFEVMTFGALGATILLNSKSTSSDPNLLIPRVQRYAGSVWVSTPSFAFAYSRIGKESRLNSIHTFLFCGEVLPQPLAKNLLTNFESARVLNTYGPTEATVATTIVDITAEIVEKYTSLPVGRCRNEGRLIIENNEIIIAGPHVSKGYMNNESLNAKKFTLIDGLRAFRTGDEGCLENGMLFFSGRNDDLVKLHGYRIELNEITSALTELAYILQAETIPLKRDGSVKKIVSIVCLRDNKELEISKESIQKDLSVNLPPYMIPSDIRIVQDIPLNSNGKADKKLLLELYKKAR